LMILSLWTMISFFLFFSPLLLPFSFPSLLSSPLSPLSSLSPPFPPFLSPLSFPSFSPPLSPLLFLSPPSPLFSSSPFHSPPSLS
ncbi:hypothetical protein FD722_20460, partial [Photobacterium damselae subsp. damselae]